MAKKWTRSPIVLAVLCIAVVGLLLANYLTSDPAVHKVRIVTPPAIIASLPHWVAIDQGFYRDAGLEVQTIDVTNSALMAQAVVGGDADVLPAVSLVDVLNNQDRPLDRPLLFSHSRMRSDPSFESILVPKASPLATVKELEGRSIAVYPGATSETALREYLKRSGVDISQVTFRPLPPPEHLAALERGDVQASHLYEPLRTKALSGGLCREFSRSVYASFNEPSAIGVSAMSNRFLTERRDVARKYLAVWDRSIAFIRLHPTEARRVLAKHLNISEAVAAQATWVDATQFREIDEPVVEATIKTVRDMKLIKDDAEVSAPSIIARLP